MFWRFEEDFEAETEVWERMCVGKSIWTSLQKQKTANKQHQALHYIFFRRRFLHHCRWFAGVLYGVFGKKEGPYTYDIIASSQLHVGSQFTYRQYEYCIVIRHEIKNLLSIHTTNMSSLGPPGAQINPEEADNFEEVRVFVWMPLALYWP